MIAELIRPITTIIDEKNIRDKPMASPKFISHKITIKQAPKLTITRMCEKCDWDDLFGGDGDIISSAYGSIGDNDDTGIWYVDSWDDDSVSGSDGNCVSRFFHIFNCSFLKI